MAVIDRHRVVRLLELSEAERTLRGPERLLREEDVKLLIRAAYDDATEAARAAFMARVQTMPTSAWPWSAVQAVAPRGRVGVVGSLAGSAPIPTRATTPALLILLRGQADTPDVDVGDRLPDRGTPEGIEWEPLYRALDAWDTDAIKSSSGPMGWIARQDAGATSGAPAKGKAPMGGAPTNGTAPEDVPADAPTNGTAPGAEVPVDAPANGTPPGADVPAPTDVPWKHPAVIVGAAAVAAGGAIVYALVRTRRRALPQVQEAAS